VTQSFELSAVEGMGKYRIYLIPISGVITDEPSTPSLTRQTPKQTNAQHIERLVSCISNDPLARGVLLRINSPGGMASASETIYESLSSLREKMPVVAHIDGMGASGAYMASLAAERIGASPWSLVGSIGVILSRFDISEGLAKIGVKFDPITTGKFKAVGSMYRALDAEERAYLEQEIVAPAMESFTSIVQKRRPQRPEENRSETESGKIFSAQRAHKLGLIDAVCSWKQAKNDLLRQLQEQYPKTTADNYSFVQLTRRTSILQTLMGNIETRLDILADMRRITLPLCESGLWYIWLS